MMVNCNDTAFDANIFELHCPNITGNADYCFLISQLVLFEIKRILLMNDQKDISNVLEKINSILPSLNYYARQVLEQTNK